VTKNLIVCCDGTWNDPDEQRHHESRPTNVAKLALMLVSDFEGDSDGAAQPRQLVHYEKGVGTSARATVATAIDSWPNITSPATACICSGSAVARTPRAASRG
jgi:uncharacterized protein (DUF2235 family)